MIVKSMLVKIGADDAQMKAALQKAGAGLKKHSASFRKAGMAMTVAGAAVTGAVTLMVKSYINAGDEVHKMALRTGMSTESLSELKYAAEISGATLGDVEKGVKKMAKTINDATKAGGAMATYVRAFEQIGLSADDLIELAPEDAFDTISKAIAGVESPMKRAALAQDIFGRAGTKLLPLFGAGEEGLEALRKKAREMGIVFDQEAANKAAVLTDSLTTLKGSFKGVSMSIATTLVPIITRITDKISTVAQKVKDWMKEHPKLGGTIMKVVVVLGGLMMVLGPLVMILPALVAGISMLSGAFSLLLGPIGLIIAAVATATIVFMKLKKAKDEVRKADERLVTAQKSLRQKLIDMKKAAGMTGEEFGLLTNKYKGNIVAMTMAIYKGKEGEKLQEALAKVSKKHKEEIDEQRKSYEVIIPKIEQYKVELQEVPKVVAAMTDEIKQATLSEYEYAKSTLEQKKLDRDTAIEKELEDQVAKQEALNLNEEAYQLALAKLEDTAAEERKTKQDEQFAAYQESKQALVDSINQMTLSEIEYADWALGQEYERQKEHIKDTVKDEKKRNELLQLLREKHLLDKKKAEQGHADEITAIQANTTMALASLYGDFIGDTLDAFGAWGEGTQGILKGIGQAFGNLAKTAIGMLKDIVRQELLTAAKSVIAEKGKAIAKVISSVMALPFPANVLAVGGAIAAVTMLFKKIKLFGKGGIAWQPTLAIVGERGPEEIRPLGRAGQTGGGFILQQTNNFYGNISNAGDVDEISRRLAVKTRRAVERGRK